jgi:hypothetical protein
MERRWALGWLVCACLVGFTGQASAQASKIAVSMGDLRWGMSESEVITFVKRKLAEQYEEQMAKASDSKKSRLRDELKSAQSEVASSKVDFEGRSSRWSSSAIAGEFVSGNGESMIIYEDSSSQNYYFFAGGRLWKWYKAFPSSSFGGSFKKFSASIEKKFGKGRAKTGEVAPGQGESQWIEYLDRNSRLRAADNAKRGVYALIFDEMATVRELASTRGPSKPASRSVEDDDDSRGSSNETTVAKAGSTRKSIFAEEEQRGETDAEYRARVKKMAADERAAQQRAHARKQDSKRGEALKPLEGMDDKDPLGGL